MGLAPRGRDCPQDVPHQQIGVFCASCARSPEQPLQGPCSLTAWTVFYACRQCQTVQDYLRLSDFHAFLAVGRQTDFAGNGVGTHQAVPFCPQTSWQLTRATQVPQKPLTDPSSLMAPWLTPTFQTHTDTQTMPMPHIKRCTMMPTIT